MSVDSTMKTLVKLGVEQGFTVEPVGGAKLKWVSPDGEQLSTPNRIIGRGAKNVQAQLVRIGLDVSSLKPAKPKEKTEEPEPDRIAGLKHVPESEPPPPNSVYLPETTKTLQSFSEMIKEYPATVDTALASFMSDVGANLFSLMEIVDLTGRARHSDNEYHELEEAANEALGVIDDLQKRVDDLGGAVQELRKADVRQRERLEKLGKELSDSKLAHNDALERAHRAEQSLKQIKSAFAALGEA